jgi:hypothetical protein
VPRFGYGRFTSIFGSALLGRSYPTAPEYKPATVVVSKAKMTGCSVLNLFSGRQEYLLVPVR